MMGSGFRVSGLGFRDEGLGFTPAVLRLCYLIGIGKFLVPKPYTTSP